MSGNHFKAIDNSAGNGALQLINSSRPATMMSGNPCNVSNNSVGPLASQFINSPVTNNTYSVPNNSDSEIENEKYYREIIDSLNSTLKYMNAKEGDSRGKESVLEGTCKWLEEKTKSYQDWEASPQSCFLWIFGLPGKGKSHIAMHAKDRLKKQKTGPLVLSYFFDAQNVLRCTEHAMILSLLYQLLGFRDLDARDKRYFCEAFRYRIPSPKSEERFSGEHLADHRYLLESMIGQVAQYREVYLILDGLDEYYHNSLEGLKALVRQLEGLQDQGQKYAVKIFISSRPLKRLQLPGVTIDLSEKKFEEFTNEDIGEFILDPSNCYLEDKRDKENFKNILIKRAEGTFLWVALAMSEGLKDQPTQKDIVDGGEAYLDKIFPSGLYPMYNRILLNILKDQYRNKRCESMVKILHCLALSQRPLSEEELGHIIPQHKRIINDTLQAFCNIISRKSFHDHEEITLIHLSLKEYLTPNRLLQRVFSTRAFWIISWRVRPYLYDTEIWLSAWSKLWILDYLLLLILMGMVCVQFSVAGFAICSSMYIYFEKKSPILYLLKKFLYWIIVIIFGIDESEVHSDMFSRCVNVLMDKNNGFKRDMFDIKNAWPLESKEKVKSEAPEKCRTFEYPCHFWARHLEASYKERQGWPWVRYLARLGRSHKKQQDLEYAYEFLAIEKHFLHWLEAASIFGFLYETAGDIRRIKGILPKVTLLHLLSLFINIANFPNI